MPYKETQECSVPSKDGQITRELRRIDERLESLANLIVKLETKLAPVLANQLEDAGGETANEETLCDIASQIRNQNKSIEYSIKKLESLRDRIEL